jgi:fructose-1,6-bisphosphatase
LKEIDGLKGRAALIAIKDRIQIDLETWRQYLEHDDSTMFELHAGYIEMLGQLAWDVNSPLYGRQMQTAARAVLPQSSGLWKEPEEPFFSMFERGTDPEMMERAKRNIAKSFGFPNPENYVIVRGHKPTKDGMFEVLAGGTVINIDGGMAEKYGGMGGAIIFGSKGAGWLSHPSLQFTQVPLPVKK